MSESQVQLPTAAWGPPGSDLSGVVKLLLRFSEAVDTRDAAQVGALFTQDGLFQPSETAIQGAPAIEDFYRKRFSDPARRTRHLWSNLMITAQDHDAAGLRAILSNYAFEPAVSTTEVQLRVGNVSALCRRGPDGDWVFAEHRFERLYAMRLPRSDAAAPTNEART